jgi:hypothetical protein
MPVRVERLGGRGMPEEALYRLHRAPARDEQRGRMVTEIVARGVDLHQASRAAHDVAPLRPMNRPAIILGEQQRARFHAVRGDVLRQHLTNDIRQRDRADARRGLRRRQSRNLAGMAHELPIDRHATTEEVSVESIRRSAAMAPLSSDEAFRVLAALEQLLRERARIAALLADLPESWTKVRGVLNELQAIVRCPSTSQDQSAES